MEWPMPKGPNGVFSVFFMKWEKHGEKWSTLILKGIQTFQRTPSAQVEYQPVLSFLFKKQFKNTLNLT